MTPEERIKAIQKIVDDMDSWLENPYGKQDWYQRMTGDKPVRSVGSMHDLRDAWKAILEYIQDERGSTR